MKRMLAILVSLALILTCAPAQLFAPALAAEAAGEEIPEGLIYRQLADGTIAISRYTGSAAELTIPDTIDGRPVTVIGREAFYGCSELTAVYLPQSLTRVEAEAFYGCTKLRQADLPEGVTYLGNRAFCECRSLIRMNIPEGATAIYDGTFYYCEKLTSVTIPDTVTKIENHAFEYCKSLTSLTLPEKLTYIGSRAFYYCWELADMSIPNSVTEVGQDAFLYTPLPLINYDNGRYLGNASNPYLVFVKTINTSVKTLTIHPDTKVIARNTFAYNNVLTSVTLPGDLVSIQSGEFSSCTNLAYSIYENGKYLGSSDNPYAYFMGAVDKTATSMVFHPNTKMITESAMRNHNDLLAVTIPVGVTTIGESAFCNCVELQTVFMADSVTTIGRSAFSACYNLKLLSYPKNLKTIGERAFNECYKLSSYEIHADVTSIGGRAFGGYGILTGFTVDKANAAYTTDAAGALLTKDGKTLVAVPNSLTSYTVPNTVTTIGEYAFAGCQNMTSVTLSDSVTVIGENAFDECRALTELVLPDSVTTIGTYAFRYCTDMTSLTLGKGVCTIGEYAFEGCYALAGIWVHEENAVYSSDSQGVLYNKDQTVLVSAPAQITKYTVPDSVIYISDWSFCNECVIEEITFGSNVTYIGTCAFYYCHTLRRVTFPDSVRTIGQYAFYGCEKLENFDLPEGLTVIGQYAFDGCAAITKLTLPDSLTIIETRAFQSCSGLTTLNLGTGVTSVVGDVLRGCTALTTVNVPEDVVSMDGWSFNYTNNLQYNTYDNGLYLGCEENPFVYLADTVSEDILDITIHADTRLIGKNVLYPCKSMTYISVDPGSTAFFSDEYGVLLSADKTVLIATPGTITEYTIPATVTTVADHAFYYRTALTAVSVPSGVTAISEYAFYNCDGLETLSLPNTLTTIGNYAFSYCDALARISFTGDAPEMAAYTFSGVTAEAHYPGGNKTWTDAVKQNYGGTITWMIVCDGHVPTVAPALAPTCTETGLTEGTYCEACGLVLKAQEELPALGHKEVQDDPVAADCETDGLTGGSHCEVCGEILVAQEAIPMLGHKWDSGIYTEPTLESDSFTTYTCTVCGATQTEIHEGTKLPAGKLVKHPEAVTADSGQTVQFSVETEGQVVSYKWEYRKVFKWFDTSMTGYNTDTLTVTATGARNGYDYRCLVTFADGTEVYSEPAELTVQTEITDIQSPNDQTVVLGYKGQFSAEAKGESVMYRWYYQRPSSELWIETSMEGCTSATVMIETTAARDGYKYRCKITDITGLEVYTEPATMRVLSFVSHPETKFSPVDESVQFTVQTSVSDGFTYQWQYRRSEAGTWNNTSMDGYNTATLNVAATLARNGYQYRCVITGSKNSKLESKAATLYVGDPVVITRQPEAVSAAVGEQAIFTVEATNVYAWQWEYASAGSNKWYNTGAEGNTTARLTVPVTANKDGYRYRCRIYGYDGIDYISDVAMLTIK